MSYILNKIYKIIYGYRATRDSYIKYIKNNSINCGEGIYIANPHKFYIDRDALKYIDLGNNIQFTQGVTVLAHDESYSVCGPVYNDYPRKQLITKIGNNCFFGINSIILMGSNIGDNVIVGAGSVVSGHLDSNSVYAGVPAKKIMTLDEYHNNLKDSFEKSAYIFIKRFIEKEGREPVEIELHMYALLFKKMNIKTAINKPDDVVKKVNKAVRKYADVKEFINEYEKKFKKD